MHSAQSSMLNLPEHLFLNPVLSALLTTHAHLAITYGKATRYPATVSPFAALTSPTTEALRDLHTLLSADEHTWVMAIGEADPNAAGLTHEATVDVPQMFLPGDTKPPPPESSILPLSCIHASEMVALTDLAFPGFFRPRTCEMGSYFGIYSPGGQLIAMAGERLVFPGYSEISGLCTHPDHRGKGYAAQLLWHVAAHQRQQGKLPWLHVAATNLSAINLYKKLGFETARSVKLHKLRRS